MIVIDSGLGGISVVRALKATRPELNLIYCADTSGFPYGKRTEEELQARSVRLVGQLLTRHPGHPVVIACNTLSTLCLDHLRKFFDVPFIGTVPAIKTAGQLSATRRFTILATPNTAGSQYTQDLIGEFASDCVVDAYGAPNLAQMAEHALLGKPINPDTLRQELHPAFNDDAYGKTDCIVLGCTHYPLILRELEAASPWPVKWIDSSDAIARRALSFTNLPTPLSIAYVTGREHQQRYTPIFAQEGFPGTEIIPLA